MFELMCFDGPNGLTLRPDVRPAHLDYIRAQGATVAVAGPILADDGESPAGSFFILDLPDRAAVEAFADGDPYHEAGVFARREVFIIKPLIGRWVE